MEASKYVCKATPTKATGLRFPATSPTGPNWPPSLTQMAPCQSWRQQVEAFLASEESKQQYQVVVEKGEALQQKQQMGMPLSEDEIAEFEKHRESLVSNPIARAFLDAQQELHKVQESVGQYVAKTLELGRMPTA